MKLNRTTKIVLFFLAGLLTLLIIVPTVYILPYTLRLQHFAANPDQGYHADFYLYLSPKARQLAQDGQPVTILVQPNNSGNSDDPEVHRKDAWWMGLGRSNVADDLGVALLVPAFLRPSKDWHIYTHALDRDVFTTDREDVRRTDVQLLAMVDQARSSLGEKGLDVHPKFLLQGYSASGMFANRFAALHPEQVRAVAAGSPGGWPIAPVEQYEDTPLPYPIGVADLKMIAGRSFQKKAYREMPQLLVMGSLDDNDSVDFTDGWDEEHAATVDRLFGSDPLTRWDDAQRLYQQAGAKARFLLIDEVGHDRKALQHWTTAFFHEVLAAPSTGMAAATFDYGTDSDSALFYFRQGWRHILDLGLWTRSEEAFRKAVEFDPDFLIGQSLVGRISRDLDERKNILGHLDTIAKKTGDAEQLLLDVFLQSIAQMNRTEPGEKQSAEATKARRTLAEHNFRKFVHQFPGESYIKAEYIEILHAVHGARTALDTLRKIASPKQRELPFFLGYAALLEAKLGQYENALETAREMEKVVHDSLVPSPYMVKAEIYWEMDSLVLANKYVQKVVHLDNNHLLAHRLKNKILRKTQPPADE